MKVLTVLLSLMVATSASAGIKVYPQIQFRKAAAWVPANKVCVDGKVLRHKTKTTTATSCNAKEKVQGNCTKGKAYVQPISDVHAKCVAADFGSKMDSCFFVSLKQGPVVYGAEYANWKHAENGYHGKAFPYVIPNCNL